MRELANYKPVKNWLLGMREGTCEAYLGYFRQFCDFTGRNPDELIAWGERKRREVHTKAKEFYLKFEAEGYSAHTCKSAYSTIRSFFSLNDIRLGRGPRGFNAFNEYESKRIFDPQLMFKLIVAAKTIRDKAVISFLAQSGQRVGVLTTLHYGQVRKQIENYSGPVVIEIKGKDNKVRGLWYSFAIGRECAELLRRMMLKRKQAGETLDDRSWLFRTYGRPPKRIGNKWVHRGPARKKERGRRLSNQSISRIVQQAAKDAGVQSSQGPSGRDQPLKVMYEVHPHAFRRWWKNAMRRGGVTDYDLLDSMMGHKVRNGGAYDSFDDDYIRKQYAKAEPQLTLYRPQSDWENGGIAMMKPSQRIVKESQLESHLANGWRYVATLPSGRVVAEAPG